METTPQVTTPANAQKPKLKERLEENVYWVMLIAFGAGFAGSLGTFKLGLETFNQDIVPRGTYVLKRELAGSVMRSEAVIAIDFLIQNGQTLIPDSPQGRTWLMQVLAFIHGIQLEKDYDWKGNRVSAVEADIRYALTDPSIDIQVQKVLGILRGLRAALQTRVSLP